MMGMSDSWKKLDKSQRKIDHQLVPFRTGPIKLIALEPLSQESARLNMKMYYYRMYV